MARVDVRGNRLFQRVRRSRERFIPVISESSEFREIGGGRHHGIAIVFKLDRIGEHTQPVGQFIGLERETGFEPATACLEGRDSTTELLPLGALSIA